MLCVCLFSLKMLFLSERKARILGVVLAKEPPRSKYRVYLYFVAISYARTRQSFKGRRLKTLLVTLDLAVERLLVFHFVLQDPRKSTCHQVKALCARSIGMRIAINLVKPPTKRMCRKVNKRSCVLRLNTVNDSSNGMVSVTRHLRQDPALPTCTVLPSIATLQIGVLRTSIRLLIMLHELWIHRHMNTPQDDRRRTSIATVPLLT